MDVRTAVTAGQPHMLTKHEIAENVNAVQKRVQQASSALGMNQKNVRLVAVSKLQPVECVKAAYDAGLRVFGENYVQEFLEKAFRLPDEIEWHFIGQIPLERAEYVAQAVPNLSVVESVDNIAMAERLNAGALTALERGARTAPLTVFVQVNTTGEKGHPGVAFGENRLSELVSFIHTNCKGLRFGGLMTIGGTGANHAEDESQEERGTEDWETLFRLGKNLAEELQLDTKQMEFSFGMSCDFEAAIAHGSDNVRVGVAIFGDRGHKNITEKEPNQIEAELREH